MDPVDDLTCTICSSIFEKPVTVICGHTFCEVCIVAALRTLPKCPICGYPSLGFQKLNTNIAIQSLIDWHTKENPELIGRKSKIIKKEESIKTSILDEITDGEVLEILKKDINFTTIQYANKTIKCIGFRLSKREKFRYFPGTSYLLEIDYSHSDELFKLLVPDHHFIGYNHPKTASNKIKLGYLFLIEKIASFSLKTVSLVAKCKSQIFEIEKSSLNFTDHKEIVKMVNDKSELILLDFICGKELQLIQPDWIQSSCVRKLTHIEKKICNFINILKDTNEFIAEDFIKRYSANSFGSKFSIDWKKDVHAFLNTVISMLNIPMNHKRVISKNYNFVLRTNLLYDFMNSASFESDPIFFLNYDLNNNISNFWANIGFLMALMLFIVTIYYPDFSIWKK